MYNVVFHDWIYIDYAVAYYHRVEGEQFDNADSIHFVSTPGEMTNRHHELLQLAIL